MVCTSPPYWGLRDYGVEGQLGLERTPEEYVSNMVEVFREVRRVLRDDGTVWLNLGDCYATGAGRVGDHPGGGAQGARWRGEGSKHDRGVGNIGPMTQPNRMPLPGLKPKDLIGIPWRVAFALQADGWWLRSEITWCKRAPMPESIEDRPTSATEKVFLLTKAARYFYDHDAVREPAVMRPQRRPSGRPLDDTPRPGQPRQAWSTAAREETGQDSPDGGRNLRNWWLLGPEPFPEAHFAVMPTRLVEPCIKAGTSARGACPACGAPWRRVTEKCATGRVRRRETGGLGTAIRRAPLGMQPVNGTFREGVEVRTTGWTPHCACGASQPVPCVVLDPFAGAGTTGLVARRLGRRFVGIELNPTYAAMAERRIVGDAPLLNGVGA